MKQESINSLQKDLDLLIEKHSQFVVKNDFGSALNVMKNIDILTSQLKRLDYKTMVSKYSTSNSKTGEDIHELAIWEQNSFGQIKNHETYKIINSGTIKNGNIVISTENKDKLINEITKNVMDVINKHDKTT